MDGNNLNNEFGGNYTDAYAEPAQQSQGNGLAIASLVLGILGVTCMYGAILPQVLAIIFGNMAKKRGQSKGMAGWGFWLGIVGLVLSIIGVVIIVAIYGAAFVAYFSAAGAY
ncbi:MAG: DUF4190 domain-containing protein [Lachnospiraceae bacterium]|nr:DUF4190 domain-containing protein [Lachnospiraceae bacterium]